MFTVDFNDEAVTATPLLGGSPTATDILNHLYPPVPG